MKRMFVVTDNKFIYEEFKKIASSRDIKVDYFCSPKSNKTFQYEIKNSLITPIVLKEDDSTLINNYELGISCHSKQLFPALLVNSLLCINIHPGLNPFNRGWFPQVFSIINGLPIGATIHIMDEEIDHGDIIVQEEVEINLEDTSSDVYNKVIKKEIELLKQYIDKILDNSFQKSSPSSEGNYNSIQDYKNLCQIDLNKKTTMKEAIDFLRAMTHPPYKNSYFIDEDGDKIYISIELERKK